MDQENLITIIDIGKNDRIELGKQLRIINSNSPGLVALDFFLVPDSLDKDSILVNELLKVDKIVQVVGLHNFDSTTNTWDSLEVSNSKFRVSIHGYSNITITDDSVLIRQLPLRQSYKNTFVPSFSYAIAENFSKIKSKYRDAGIDDISFPYLQVNSGYSVISKDDLMSGNFDKSNIQGKILLLGYIGYGDDYYLDHGRHWKVNGVAIHAAIINEIIDR